MTTYQLIYLPTGRAVAGKTVQANTERGAKQKLGRLGYVNWDLHAVIEVA